MAASIGQRAGFNFVSKLQIIGVNAHIFHFRTLAKYGRRRVLKVWSQEEAGAMPQSKTNVDLKTHRQNIGFSPQIPSVSQKAPSFVIPDKIKYELISDGDKRFGPFLQLAKSRKERSKSGLILLEGKHNIQDAIEAGVRMKNIYFVKGEDLEGLPLEDLVQDGTGLFKVKMRHMQLWTDLVKASGIMAVCHMPSPGECLTRQEAPLPLTLVCDGIKDPGNLGMLIRSAAAVCCDKVLFTKGCVDIWDPRVLRAACAHHFYVPLYNNIGWELLSNYFDPDSRIYIADCHSDKVILSDNVKPQRKHKRIISNHSEQPVEEEIIIKNNERQIIDNSHLDKDIIEAFDFVEIPLTNYFDKDFTEFHTVLIVGESDSPSAHAKKLAFEKHGERLYLPMTMGVDSVTPAVAGSVVMYEIKRQLSSQPTVDYHPKVDMKEG